MAELRLLSYNVRSLRDDAAAVAEVIRACRPDVVAVQEAPRFLRWRSKRAALARESELVVATANRPGGLMLMTTLAVAVRGTGFALLPKTPKLHQRAVCFADLELGGARWTIASIHLSLDDAERSQHLPALWHALDVDETGGRSVADAPALVVAGDVNERPSGAVWSALGERLQDAYVVAPDGPGDTYSSRRPHKRIDGVFADRRIEVVSCTAVHGGGEVSSGEGVDAELLARASDHLPVLAVLRQPD
ncbi:MAG: endonuclease/exonuclease/phosphatase family protein [Frankiales bacterium]|nr:endonuclease/exonuclease/phosphatase family protein [Frankiales bacterium]